MPTPDNQILQSFRFMNESHRFWSLQWLYVVYSFFLLWKKSYIAAKTRSCEVTNPQSHGDVKKQFKRGNSKLFFTYHWLAVHAKSPGHLFPFTRLDRPLTKTQSYLIKLSTCELLTKLFNIIEEKSRFIDLTFIAKFFIYWC